MPPAQAVAEAAAVWITQADVWTGGGGCYQAVAGSAG